MSKAEMETLLQAVVFLFKRMRDLSNDEYIDLEFIEVRDSIEVLLEKVKHGK